MSDYKLNPSGLNPNLACGRVVVDKHTGESSHLTSAIKEGHPAIAG